MDHGLLSLIADTRDALERVGRIRDDATSTPEDLDRAARLLALGPAVPRPVLARPTAEEQRADALARACAHAAVMLREPTAYDAAVAALRAAVVEGRR